MGLAQDGDAMSSCEMLRPWSAILGPSLFAAAILVAPCAGCGSSAPARVLLFSKTAGFRHDSIPAGLVALKDLARQEGLAADATEDASVFQDALLARYVAIVFLSVTGDVLDAGQRAAFERYVRAGGGFMGIHAAADSGYDWPFYGETVGAYFKNHPALQPGTLVVEDSGQAATVGLPLRWRRTDEWYNFRSNPRPAVHVLLTLDESSITGGEHGADHPMAWCHGRAFYTALGHSVESYSEPFFVRHLAGGLRTAAGRSPCSAR